MDKSFSEEKIFEENPLVLAFVGDSVETLYVRTSFVPYGYKVNKLNKLVSEKINARAQAEVFVKIEPWLNDREKSVASRARNANIHHTAKNFSVIEYRLATSLEAVIGYLYLTGNYDRLNKILEECI